jgi:cell wall-associated NlpC family hydrolase
LLPANKTGWLKGSGLIHISLGEMIPVTNPDDFAATALRLKGTSYLLNGLSAMGIDAPGLVFISARINGINLPRTIEGQLASGTEIAVEDTRAGDLVFLAGTGENEGDHVTCVGICTGGGSYLYAGRKTGYVAVGDINRENQDGKVTAARRIFNDAD